MAISVERRELSRGTLIRRSLLSRERFSQVAILAAVLAVWQYAGSQLGDFFLAPPTSVLAAFGEVVSSGQLWEALQSTLVGILVGFFIAAVLGVTIGVLMGTSRAAAAGLNPLVSAGYVIPEAAIVPLLIIWFGLGMEPRIIAVVLFAVFEIIVSTYAGVKNIDPILPEVARSFGAGSAQIFRKVICMAALPYIFAGLRMGAARAVKGMVVAELLFAATGVGGAIKEAANGYRTDKVMVFVIVITVLGVLFAGLVQFIERKSMRAWHEQYVER